MKLNERHIHLAVAALFYLGIAACFALRPSETPGLLPAVLLPLVLQLCTALRSRQRNALAASLTLIPPETLAVSLARAGASLSPAVFLPGLLAALTVRLINGLRRWPDARSNTLRWTGAAVCMVSVAATAALLLA